MKYKNLGTSKIPALGLGTWGMGGKDVPDTTQDKENISLLQQAIDLGITLIDTAEFYGNGHTEELIGEAIANYKRENLFLCVRVGFEHLRYNDVITSAKNSLKRLHTDYIDLFSIQKPNPDIPLKETLEAMNTLRDTGIVKHLGVSNFAVPDLREAMRYSQNEIVANHLEYNLCTRNQARFNTDVESKIIPFCQENNIAVIAWRPLALGKLAKVRILEDLSHKYHKTPSQIALNWLISKKGIVTIPKSSSIAHIQENLGSMGWHMSQADYDLLERCKEF